MRWLQRRARNWESYEVRNLFQDALPPELVDAWELVITEIEGVRQLALANDLPLLLVIAPYKYQLENPQALGQPQKRLLQWAASTNTDVVDLLPYFADIKKQNPKIQLFADNVHFSNDGHLLAADILVDPIVEMLRAL